MARIDDELMDETLRHERRAVQLFIDKHPTYEYIHTPKEGYSKVDALLMQNNVVKAVVETKCRRKLSLDDLRNRFNYEWLLSHDKVEAGRQLATTLEVPFVGFLYLIDDDILLVQRLCNVDGTYAVDMSIRATETKATMEGGKIIRNNAYIDMSNATLFRADTF